MPHRAVLHLVQFSSTRSPRHPHSAHFSSDISLTTRGVFKGAIHWAPGCFYVRLSIPGMPSDPPSVYISKARRADALEFYQVEAKCFEMDADDRDTTYYWTPMLEYMYCLKAVTGDGSIVGGAVTMPTYDQRWYVNSLFVLPEYRRCGIARKMMDMVVSVAEQRGCSMVLDVKTDRPHLLKFYGSLGFATSYRSADHYRDGEDRFIMTRPAPGSR